MAEYNLDFAERMLESSEYLLSSAKPESEKAAIYNSLLACEIALKSALELAGKPLKDIPWSHNLSELLGLVTGCTLEVQVGDTFRRLPATSLRAKNVDPQYAKATVGHLLQAETLGASKYPNQIRYGETLKHFPASVVANLARVLINWVRQNAQTIEA